MKAINFKRMEKETKEGNRIKENNESKRDSMNERKKWKRYNRQRTKQMK